MQNSELIGWIIQRCNQVLFGNDKVDAIELNKVNLDRALSLASLHGMLPVLMQNIEKCKVADTETRKVIIKWYAVSENAKISYKFRLSLMEQLALEFKKANLDVMFLKGASLANFYPTPECRVFSDIDYYMFGKSKESVGILKRMGIKTEEYFNHHTQATFNGVLLENHYDFLDIDNHQSNQLLDEELKHLALKEGKKYPFNFENATIDNAYCMSPTMNAIFLIRHMAGHFFAESVSLRMMYDWALFLDKDSAKVDWDNVTMLYDRSGLTTFVKIVQGVLAEFFGLNFEHCPITPERVEIVERVWDSILNPPAQNPHRYNTLSYLSYETKVFITNRWKHHLVYPDESYWKLFASYVSSYLKKKLHV